MSKTSRGKTPMKAYLWLSLLSLVVIVALFMPRASMAQGKTLYWDRYDVNITVEENGDILVEEIQEIVFTSGTFRFGFAEIPLERIERIVDVSVSEIIEGQERAYTRSTGEYGFTNRRSGNNQEIKWYFPPTSNSRHTYILRYTAKGALRTYGDFDQVWWKAIPADRGFPVHDATVTVTLPETFLLEQLDVDAYGVPVDNIAYTESGNLVFQASDIAAGEELEVSVKFPSGVVAATAPTWQAADDLRRGWGPLVGLLSGALGLFFLVGGLVGVYVLWYRRGRDTDPGTVPEYVTEPPSSLPAGLVGTLIDEHADFKDIIASMFDLAERGAIRMGDHESVDRLRFGRGFVFYLKNPDLVIYPHEQRLLLQIFGYHPKVGVGAELRTLEDLRLNFHHSIPQLKRDLYQGVVEEELFPASPRETRKRWFWLAIGGLAISLVGAVVLYNWFGHLSAAVVWPALGLVPGLAALAIISGHMPQKTAAGAEEAAKWLAFKNYLENLEAHGELEAVKDKFETYFPYAIAFGLEKRLIYKFSKVDAPAPSWWEPVLRPDVADAVADSVPSMSVPSGSASVPSPRLAGRIGGGGKGSVPPLAGISEGLGSSLASMSQSLGGLLNSTASVLVKPPPPPPPPPSPPSFDFDPSTVDGLEIAGKVALFALEIGLAAAGGGGGGGGGGGSRGFG